MAEIERSFNINQSAQLLGLKPRTVRNWISEGRIKAKKLEGSNRWIIMESEIRRLRGEDNH